MDNCTDSLVNNDVITAIVIGLIGGTVTSSKKLKEIFDAVHTDASLAGGSKTLLGKILHHSGDCIDHITRGGKPFATYLHRLYGGHDPFSIRHGDNPFVLLCRQYGILRGILQTCRHLIADTFSKNGGVLPFSSYLDYKRADGSIGNRLDDWSRSLAEGTGLSSQTVYAEVFSIHMQDICSVEVVNLLTRAYVKSLKFTKCRKPLSRLCVCQMKIIALVTTIYSSVGCGVVRNNGCPKVNVSAVMALSGEITRLLHLNHKDLNAVITKGNELEARLMAVC